MALRAPIRIRFAPLVSVTEAAAILLALVGLATTSAACSKPCVDMDLDGYGAHCAKGPDCDDTDAARNVDCVHVPPPDCTADPTATGCACSPLSSATCFDFATGTPGVGVCVAGTKICRNGHFGLCTGSVGPSPEICDGLDNDCNGRVDDGVLSPCGGCDSSCTGGIWGPGGTPFSQAPGLSVLDTGSVELSRGAPPSPGLFVSNAGEDTLSRIDVATATEVARHPVGDEPTRVAVDTAGDVFVANLAPNAEGTVSKLATDLARCIDSNGTPGIQTSTGPQDVPPFGADECVLFTSTISASGEEPRAIAIDGRIDPNGVAHGDAWVGLHEGEAIVHVDGATGAVLARVETPGFAPFAAAIDPQGYVWMASQDGYLVRVDPSTTPPSYVLYTISLPCYLVDDLAISAEGEILVSGSACDQVVRFDPASSFSGAATTLPNARGLVIGDGIAWLAHTDGRVTALTIDPLRVLSTGDLRALGTTPIDTSGIALDALGAVWTVSRLGGPSGTGIVTRVDATTSIVNAQVPVGLGALAEGDLTGRSRYGTRARSGVTTARFSGCSDNSTQWRALHVFAAPSPVGAITIEARFASTLAALDAATFASIATLPPSGSTIPLSIPDGGYVELRLTLSTTSTDATPRVDWIGVEWSCNSSVVIE